MTDNGAGPFAHTAEGLPPSAWEPLEQHLRGVAALAEEFAADFDSADAGRLAGLWHDLGKYAPDWQEFLLEAGRDAAEINGDDDEGYTPSRRRGPDHSTAGAIHALRTLGPSSRTGLALAFAIAAHHAGLPDKTNLQSRTADPEKQRRYQNCMAKAAAAVVTSPNLDLPTFLRTQASRGLVERRFETFVRMLFSALVDADRLATEAFTERTPEKAAARRRWPALRDYIRPLDAHLEGLESEPATTVNAARRRVLSWCREAASGPPGAYTLTVPTGGGKTLSSLAFALRHAHVHGLRRVIVALPFISILDQTADVFRKVFEEALGADVLVEHHSNLRPERATLLNSLSSENWDAPLLVTTQVQLFESLFSNRPGDCRKIHNLARSMLILDEVQTLPVGLLAPMLDQLQQLQANYGTSLLLTTATQPALHRRELGPHVFEGLDPAPTEIVPAGAMDGLFAALDRVEVHWPASPEAASWESLAKEILAQRQVLAVVHSRGDSRTLWQECERLQPESALHLSALMCPAHRRERLTEIKARLDAGRDCRLVSTQLVEAGVDLDFPVVYRAMAGMESLAQAAGRCNREGRLTERGEKGRFVVFTAASDPPPGLRQHADIARIMLANAPGLSLFRPSTFRDYFDRLYGTNSRDASGIQPLREALRFAATAATFRMIDDAGATVFVPYGPAGDRAITGFRQLGPSRDRLRTLQPFGVSVAPWALERLRDQGAVELLHDTIHVLAASMHYDLRLGLLIEPPDPFQLLSA